MKTRFTKAGRLLVAGLGASLVLVAGPAAAQNAETLETVRPKIDWSGNQNDNQVDTSNRQSRFDPLSTIPDSDNDNRSNVTRRYVRDRGAVVPDRMGGRVQPARSGAIIR